MTEDLSKLKEIIRANIRNIKEVADALVQLREKAQATEETVSEVLDRIEQLENSNLGRTQSGVRMFGVNSNSISLANSLDAPDLDLEGSDLSELISQHPSWLRPFSVPAEIEKHGLDGDIFRIKRSSAGYLRVVRLSNGTEWAYFEAISADRFSRIPLLGQLFDFNGDQESWSTAWVSEPLRLQSLQKGSRWEVLGRGKFCVELI